MKKCIITGGNSGIGYQAAKQLADKGWQVTIFCRSKERAERQSLVKLVILMSATYSQIFLT